MSQQPFSKRHNYLGPAPEVTVREDAPERLRVALLETASNLGFGPSSLRSVVCRVLRVRANSTNWSDYPNVWEEVQELVHGADWFRVYDIIEAVFVAMSEWDDRNQIAGHGRPSFKFAEEINGEMVETGIGWQLVDGQIITRGEDSFQAAVSNATAVLIQTERPTAAKHVHDALQALSRRPEADLSGAIYHAMGALEAVARDLVGDEKATLGDILKHYPDLLPSPLDKALSQVWGFASNEARHVVEGRHPTRDEAELIVGLASTLATYLTKKTPRA